jgi:imidazolonepropionase-like amidohydrolase
MPLTSFPSIALALIAMLASVQPRMVLAQTLAIRGATVIDGTGRAPLQDAVVLIEKGRISRIGRTRDVAIPRETAVVEAQGKYLVPGLMDANIHLNFVIQLETMIKYEQRYDEIAVEAAQIALKSGLTTVFDTAGQRAALVKARDAINAGKTPGARIFLAGYILGFTGPLGSDFRDPAVLGYLSKGFAQRVKDTWEEGIGQELLWKSADDVRPVIRDYTRKGVDFLKYGGSAHGPWPAVTFNFLAFSPRAQRAIIEEGHAAGLTVQAHVTSIESLDAAIDAGVDIITHGDVSGIDTPIPQATLVKLAQRRIPVSIIPATQRYLDTERELYTRYPPKVGYAWPQFQQLSRINQANMIKAGVNLLLSTDGSLSNPVLVAESGRVPVDPASIGEGHFNALLALEELGMAPMEILKSATSNIARAYQVDGELGTLEPGKFADMLILDADPLHSARNYRGIHCVIKGGVVVDREALPIAPLITAKAATGN